MCTPEIIVAMDQNGLIGVSGSDMPWGRKLRTDLQMFKERTTGHSILMGRKTFTDDIKRPLPNRHNMVITRNKDLRIEGVTIVNDLFNAQLRVPKDMNCYIIGGAELYAQALPYVNDMYITRVQATFEGDVFFPKFKEDEWQIVHQTSYDQGERDAYPFTIEHWKRLL